MEDIFIKTLKGKTLQTIEREKGKQASRTGGKGTFVSYFILVNDPHKVICVSSKSASSVAEVLVFPGASSLVLINTSSPKSCHNVSRNPRRFKELCLQKLDQIQVEEKSTKNYKNLSKQRRVNPYGWIITSADVFQLGEKNLEKGEL